MERFRQWRPRTGVGAGAAGVVGLLMAAANSSHATTVNEDFKLSAADGAPGDQFGWSLACDEDVVASTRPFPDGAAYVLRFDGAAWTQEAKLTDPDVFVTTFGSSVAVSGDLVVVGDPFDILVTGGAAHAYRFDGTSWHEEAKLTPSDRPIGVGDGFAHSVSCDGDVALMMACSDFGHRLHLSRCPPHRLTPARDSAFAGRVFLRESRRVVLCESDNQR